jgi:hypothetical protein
MPGWAKPHDEPGDDSWKQVLFIRSLRQLTPAEREQQSTFTVSAHYVGSASCQKCHAQIYERWRKTPMANVVRDPREFPDAIIPNLASNTISKFTREDVALVYGSLWKQRYFTKRGDDYFPEPAQWDVINIVWRPYFVAPGTDWWSTLYLRTTCSARPVPPAMAATPSTTTSTPKKSPNGMWAASVATGLEASMLPIPPAATLSILPAWTTSRPATPASSATRKAVP